LQKVFFLTQLHHHHASANVSAVQMVSPIQDRGKFSEKKVLFYSETAEKT
jgi:hypothetical protein